MEDVRAVREQRGQVRLLDRRLDETEPWLAAERGDVALLHRARVVVGEGVEADDVGPVGDEALGERRPDEPGDTGDERLHASSPRTRAGSRHARPLRSTVA